MALINEKTRILFNLFLPQQKKPNPKHAIPESDKNLSGKTIVFTGGTDGIGRVAVEMLYMMGANVVLLERIKESASSRIVNLTTNTVFIDHIDFEDIQSKPDIDTSQTYMEAKLSMNMFSIDLAQKLKGTGVTVNYLCPGYIKSNS